MKCTGIMHNGQSIIDDYGQSLDRLKVGDRVGVLRKENGDLHFYVNGIDQGVAATDVSDAVYGVIDCNLPKYFNLSIFYILPETFFFFTKISS